MSQSSSNETLYLEQHSGPLLSEFEMDALARDDFGIESVEMMPYDTLEAFKQRSNNFHLAFSAIKGGVAWYLNRGQRPVQRFGILYPELMHELTTRLERPATVEWFTIEDDETWRLLHEAYQKMSKLVDRNDPGVMRDGKVDSWYLCR